MTTQEAAVLDRDLVTRDLDEAQQLITSVYIPHRLASRDGQPLDFKLRHMASSMLTIGHLRYGADAELLVPPMVSCYHVNLTLYGRTDVSQGADSAFTEPGRSAVVFNPLEPFTVRWSPEAVQYAIKIPRASLEGQLSALLARPVDHPIRMSLGFDVSSPRGQSLLAAVQHLRTELSRAGGIGTVPLVRAQLESYVLSQLLLTIPHQYVDLLDASGAPARKRHVQLAMDYIDEHATDPITGADIARAACISMRALQAGFRDELGMSPMNYLRNKRLESVHAELLLATAQTSVSEVAHRWGFQHLGRFADQYRRKFGVLPSDTARRTA